MNSVSHNTDDVTHSPANHELCHNANHELCHNANDTIRKYTAPTRHAAAVLRHAHHWSISNKRMHTAMHYTNDTLACRSGMPGIALK
jgi:hypothetical protein